MSGKLEVRLVHVSKKGTRTETVKSLNYTRHNVETILDNPFFASDPYIQEWGESVFKLEESSDRKGKRPLFDKQTDKHPHHNTWWQGQYRENGKFAKSPKTIVSVGEGTSRE
jgi:hypothetical protein